MMFWTMVLTMLAPQLIFAETKPHDCPHVPLKSCCTARWSSDCVPKHCFNHVINNCPERKTTMFSRRMSIANSEKRRAPEKDDGPRCGTRAENYQPCLGKNLANKLFQSCCSQFLPESCHPLCTYETDQAKTRHLLTSLISSKKCGMEHLSGVLYCASQNRDNRKCCTDLDLNAASLNVGIRCLRMCDPSGTAIDRITIDDVTCLFNWNVIMYCHHSGIREM